MIAVSQKNFLTFYVNIKNTDFKKCRSPKNKYTNRFYSSATNTPLKIFNNKIRKKYVNLLFGSANRSSNKVAALVNLLRWVLFNLNVDTTPRLVENIKNDILEHKIEKFKLFGFAYDLFLTNTTFSLNRLCYNVFLKTVERGLLEQVGTFKFFKFVNKMSRSLGNAGKALTYVSSIFITFVAVLLLSLIIFF